MDGTRPHNMRRAWQRTARRAARCRRDVHQGLRKTRVAEATGTGRGLALEDVTGLRGRTLCRPPPRAKLAGWRVAQRSSVGASQAKLAGIPVALVAPRHTRRGCSPCRHVAHAPRRSPARCSCTAGDAMANAACNAARHIQDRAPVKAPQVAGRVPQQLWLLAGVGASDKLSLDRFPAISGSRWTAAFATLPMPCSCHRPP